MASPRPPKGLPHASPGAELNNTVAIPSRAAPDLARGWADARPTGRPKILTSKIKYRAVAGPPNVEKY